MSEADAVNLHECEFLINRCIRQKTIIEKEQIDDFDTIRISLNEDKKLHCTDNFYRIDTELDQIMACFKMSFANLCDFFLIKCSGDRKFIDLEMKSKEPDLMDNLYKGLQILNTMQVHDLNGRVIELKV